MRITSSKYVASHTQKLIKVNVMGKNIEHNEDNTMLIPKFSSIFYVHKFDDKKTNLFTFYNYGGTKCKRE